MNALILANLNLEDRMIAGQMELMEQLGFKISKPGAVPGKWEKIDLDT